MAKKKMTLKEFEKSKYDKEVKGKGKEGSKQEEAFDRRQMKAKGLKKGGMAKCSAGGVMRGTGAAVKGKKFSYNG